MMKTSNITHKNWRLSVLRGLLTILMAGYLMVPDVALAKGKNGFVLETSRNDFATTVQKLQQAVSAQKLVLLKDYNVQMMIKMVGVKSKQSMTFAIFHPRYGKVIYENDPDAFAAVPLQIIVQERGKKVVVGYKKPSEVFSDYDVPKKTKKELDKLLENIVKSATG